MKRNNNNENNKPLKGEKSSLCLCVSGKCACLVVLVEGEGGWWLVRIRDKEDIGMDGFQSS